MMTEVSNRVEEIRELYQEINFADTNVGRFKIITWLMDNIYALLSDTNAPSFNKDDICSYIVRIAEYIEHIGDSAKRLLSNDRSMRAYLIEARVDSENFWEINKIYLHALNINKIYQDAKMAQELSLSASVLKEALVGLLSSVIDTTVNNLPIPTTLDLSQDRAIFSLKLEVRRTDKVFLDDVIGRKKERLLPFLKYPELTDQLSKIGINQYRGFIDEALETGKVLLCVEAAEQLTKDGYFSGRSEECLFKLQSLILLNLVKKNVAQENDAKLVELVDAWLKNREKVSYEHIEDIMRLCVEKGFFALFVKLSEKCVIQEKCWPIALDTAIEANHLKFIADFIEKKRFTDQVWKKALIEAIKKGRGCIAQKIYVEIKQVKVEIDGSELPNLLSYAKDVLTNSRTQDGGIFYVANPFQELFAFFKNVDVKAKGFADITDKSDNNLFHLLFDSFFWCIKAYDQDRWDRFLDTLDDFLSKFDANTIKQQLVQFSHDFGSFNLMLITRNINIKFLDNLGSHVKGVLEHIISEQLEIEDKDKLTPLELAVMKGNSSLFVCFLDKGADFKRVNADGQGILHLAFKTQHIKIFKFIYDCEKLKDIDWNQQDKDGNTPLHLICKEFVANKNRQVLLNFLRFPVNTQIPNNDRQLPIGILAEAVKQNNPRSQDQHQAYETIEKIIKRLTSSLYQKNLFIFFPNKKLDDPIVPSIENLIEKLKIAQLVFAENNLRILKEILSAELERLEKIYSNNRILDALKKIHIDTNNQLDALSDTEKNITDNAYTGTMYSDRYNSTWGAHY